MYLDNLSTENLLLPSKPLTHLGDFLVKFGENSLFSMWVKNIQDFKHIMSNTVCRKKWGLEKEGLENLTTREVLTQVKNFSTIETELNRIAAHEQHAIRNNQQTNFSQILLTYEGFVSVQQTTLIPAFGNHNKLTALVGIAYDLTRYTNLLYLLEMYQQFYPLKKQAIFHFTNYCNLDEYFTTPLSYHELKLLLAMTSTTKAKPLAQILALSTKTIANYTTTLKDKLKTNINLSLVLHTLQNHQQWTPTLAAF